MFNFLQRSPQSDLEYTPRRFRHHHVLLIAAVVAAFASIPVGYGAFLLTAPAPVKVLDALITATPVPTDSPTPSPTSEPTPSVAPSAKPTEAAKKETAPAPAVKSVPKTALGFPNNKVGIHAYADPRDVELAAELVNTSGGDWGWVTMNYDINDR